MRLRAGGGRAAPTGDGADGVIPPEGMAVVLLAAGRSRRFGGNKLAALLHDSPVIDHAARTLGGLGFRHALVVAAAETPDIGNFGFRTVPIAAAEAPLSASLARGVDAAAELGASSVLVALADMPFVPVAHYHEMFDAFADGADRVATGVGDIVQPPAIFGGAHFDGLRRLSGDTGARALLEGSRTVMLDPDAARDIDTASDLARLNRPG